LSFEALNSVICILKIPKTKNKTKKPRNKERGRKLFAGLGPLVPQNKGGNQQPEKSFLPSDIKITKTPKSKKPQIKYWGMRKTDSKKMPTMKDRQRKNNIFDGVI